MQKNKKKVMFVMPSLGGGGAERVVSIIANYLAEREYNVNICLLRENNVAYKLNNNVHVECIISKSTNGIKRKLQTLRDLRKLVKKNPGTVFISFLTNENLYLAFSTLGLPANIVVSERNDPYKTINGKLNRSIVNLLYSIKQCKTVVFQTNGAMEFYNKKVQKKGIIIPNPIKKELPEIFVGIRRKEIVTFARLEPQKNYPLLINAFELFSKKYKDYTLGIYGKGELEEQLKLLVKEKGLDSKVNFYGFCADVHNKIRDAAMFVLPSDYEGLSNSMLEAMAIGLPCICTDCSPGGARMFIKNGINGILVPVKNVDKMYEAMDLIASDSKLANELSQNASKIQTHLSVEAIGNKWRALIDNL